VWHPPATLPFVGNNSFPDDKLILLFFDEANAPRAPVSAVAYQIVNDRRCGEHELKPNVRMVMAGNREGDRGVTNKQPLPLSNRLIHCEVGRRRDAWCEWAQENGVPPVAIAFFQFRKDLLNTFDPMKPEKTFCTPRTAEKAWRYYADEEMPLDVKQAAMAGAVGDGVAAEMWGFVNVWQEVAQLMPRILKEPTTVKIPEKIDMQLCGRGRSLRLVDEWRPSRAVPPVPDAHGAGVLRDGVAARREARRSCSRPTSSSSSRRSTRRSLVNDYSASNRTSDPITGQCSAALTGACGSTYKHGTVWCRCHSGRGPQRDVRQRDDNRDR
jgi:hypothetical protein